MNKMIKAKAAYIVHAKVGRDESDGYWFGKRVFLKAVHQIKARFWIFKVNHMKEGDILRLYYSMTGGR